MTCWWNADSSRHVGVQASGEQVGKWFNGIGDGIKDLGQKL